MKNKELKYEYLLKCWGGFWNPLNIKIHKEPQFDYKWFDTLEERNLEINRLNHLKEVHSDYLNFIGTLNDSCIAMRLSEGYLTRFEFIIKSLISSNNEIIEIENNLGYGFISITEFDKLGNCADYMKEWNYDSGVDVPDNHIRLFSTLILK